MAFLWSVSIATWNAAVSLCFRCMLIPLICGNTIVMKSNEYCPRSHEAVVELMHEVSSRKNSTVDAGTSAYRLVYHLAF